MEQLIEYAMTRVGSVNVNRIFLVEFAIAARTVSTITPNAHVSKIVSISYCFE